MAAQILFKIVCPSCEAEVPIRDESRIGKKIECPKCKFRFVVEEPGHEGEAAPAPKKPAKKKSNATMLIGAGVGSVAVIVLAVVGYLMMSGGDEKKPLPKANALASANPTKTDTAATTDGAAPEKSGDTAKTDGKATDAPKAETPVVVQSEQPVPAAGTSGDITNMLPNETMSAAVINIDKLKFSTLGEQLFESKIGFRPGAFKEKMGIGIDEMVKYVRGENPEQKWSFNVIRTSKPVSIKELEKVLNFKKGSKSPIKGRAYYEIPQNDLLDNLGTALNSDLELRQAKEKKDDPVSPLGLLLRRNVENARTAIADTRRPDLGRGPGVRP